VRRGVAAKHGTATYGDVAEFWRGVEPAFERALAVTFPLIANRSLLWDDQLRWMARFAETRLLDQGLVVWTEMSAWCAWLFGNCCGGFAVAADNLDAGGSLLTSSGATANGSPLGLLIPGESGVAVGVGVMSDLEPQQRHLLPYHEYVLRYLGSMESMRDRYGEFAADQQTLQRAINDFNFLATLAVAKVGGRVMASWSMVHDGAVEIARRIRSSEHFRDQIARAVGVGTEELAQEGNELLQAGAVPPVGYFISNAEL
jgi:hypothetical protein